LTVETSDVGKVNLYNIRVTAFLVDPLVTAFLDFDVDVRDNCENIVITPASDFGVTYGTSDPL
jgi:hypothetical protein